MQQATLVAFFYLIGQRPIPRKIYLKLPESYYDVLRMNSMIRKKQSLSAGNKKWETNKGKVLKVLALTLYFSNEKERL